eukprot:GHVH01009421.1.p2 GENE.GHVH01009421.1~~GHVH01009421.1.p2  ORF type:complete len:119 (+),score=22.33 GHVH01009421.1:687-1043(+)
MPSPPNYVDVVREVPVMNYVEVVHYEDEVVWEVQETERHVPEVTEVHKFVDTFVDETQEREEVVVKPSEEYVKHPLTDSKYLSLSFPHSLRCCMRNHRQMKRMSNEIELSLRCNMSIA